MFKLNNLFALPWFRLQAESTEVALSKLGNNEELTAKEVAVLEKHYADLKKGYHNQRRRAEAAEEKLQETQTKVRAYEALTPNLKTRHGYSFQNARVNDYFGMMPDGETHRCQILCEGCKAVMEVERDGEGRIRHKTINLPSFCHFLVLGLEKDSVVDLDQDRTERP